MFELINGFSKQLYMSVDELNKHGKRYSQTYRKGYGLWADETMKYAMMEKTILKRLLSKYGVLSVEMQQAIKSDFGVLGENDSVRYIDNEENAINLDATMVNQEEVEPMETLFNNNK